jgi:hypothetical protein
MMTMMVVVVVMMMHNDAGKLLNDTDETKLATLYFICTTGLTETVDGP